MLTTTKRVTIKLRSLILFEVANSFAQKMARWAVLSGLFAVSEAAFYLPGVAPKSYKTRDNVRAAPSFLAL